MPKFDLNGKVVLITGASGGLGEALARELAAQGASLALASRNQAELQRVAAYCKQNFGGEAKVYALDVTRASDAQNVVEAVLKDFGKLDVIINNAGLHAFASVAELPEGILREALEVNLYGPLRLIQAALPSLRQSKGMVVNIGSNLSFRSIPTGGAYSATKGALARLTESLRDEETKNGVHVLHACPGVVLTKLRDNALSHRVTPRAQDQLPYPRTPEATAKDIVKAMQSKKREVLSAALPVKIWAKVLAPWFGGLLDRRMKINPA
jgi:short-subunit dehydrogenase